MTDVGTLGSLSVSVISVRERASERVRAKPLSDGRSCSCIYIYVYVCTIQ